MNVYDYIDYYGIYTFEEKKFNEVDGTIFAFLSYADFTGIFDNAKKHTINEIGNMHLGIHKEKDRNIVAVKEANKLIRYIKDVKRYKDCIVSNYVHISTKDLQFGAIIIEYMKKHLYVSFEGTDQLFSSWKESFILGCEFPTKSHKLAIKYLNRHLTFTNKKVIVGGHSKGGNLALVASMYANFFVRRKIKFIYSGDGPGLLDKEFNSKRYQKVKDKYLHIMPNYSFVGLLLCTGNNKVVKCKKKSLFAHDSLLWEVKDNHFVETELSTMSTEIQKTLKEWFYKYSTKEKRELVENVMQVFEDAGVDSLLDIKMNASKIFTIISKSKNIKGKNKKMLNDFVSLLIKSIATAKKEEFKGFINNIFNRNKDVNETE